MEIMKTIADRLKIARGRRGWTQAQLAIAAGVSTGTVGNIESGARQSPGSLPKLAKALEVNHDWLSYEDGPMIPAIVQSGAIPPDYKPNQPIAPVDTLPVATKDIATQSDPLRAMAALYDMLPPDQRNDAVKAATKAMAAFISHQAPITVNHENPASSQDLPEFSHAATRNKAA